MRNKTTQKNNKKKKTEGKQNTNFLKKMNIKRKKQN